MKNTVVEEDVLALNLCARIAVDLDLVSKVFDSQPRTCGDFFSRSQSQGFSDMDICWTAIAVGFFDDAQLSLFSRWCAWEVKDSCSLPEEVLDFLRSGDSEYESKAAEAVEGYMKSVSEDVGVTAAAYKAADLSLAACTRTDPESDKWFDGYNYPLGYEWMRSAVYCLSRVRNVFGGDEAAKPFFAKALQALLDIRDNNLTIG